MIHDILNVFFSAKRKRFIKDSLDLQSVQTHRLERIYRNLSRTQHFGQLGSAAELLQQPISSYSDYERLIEKQINTKERILSADVKRYEYTSGSTKSKKKIPYSSDFLTELNEASSVWMADLYAKYPGIKKRSPLLDSFVESRSRDR